MKLTGAALLVSLTFAVAMAVLTANRRFGRRIAGFFELLLASTPSFWLGIVLLFIFSFTLRWFPVAGDRNFSALVLPALSLGLAQGAVVAQVLRRGLEDALNEPFALTLRAWGLGNLTIRLRHALRHAALPAVTLTGWLIGGLLSGAVITEQVFGRPGLGKVTVDAVLGKDLPVVLAVAIFSALVYVVMSTLVDILYLLIDPRLRDQTLFTGRRSMSLSLSLQRRRSWPSTGLAVAALFLIFVLLAVLFPSLISQYDPLSADPINAQLPPSAAHWLGPTNWGATC
ncbi:Glutathione transport system permease protein gsiC [Ewingella americana]|uniref:Glutathione transport system permease protein gsiC n=1 Tax=Ewingella americana TaxID=41202 RepID=A0A377TC47_9GAMM|nr:Glutathione transport system permease protein gsiC [Ewingella americana]